MCWFARKSSVRGVTSRSGDMYNSRNSPDSTCRAIRRFSSGACVLLTEAAGMPRIVYVSTGNVYGNTRGVTVDETRDFAAQALTRRLKRSRF